MHIVHQVDHVQRRHPVATESPTLWKGSAPLVPPPRSRVVRLDLPELESMKWLLALLGFAFLAGGYGLWWVDHGLGVAVMLASLIPLLTLSVLTIRKEMRRRSVRMDEVLREQDRMEPSPWGWGDFGGGEGDGGGGG